MSVIAEFCRRLWSGLRAVSGDDAYERYLEHCRRRHPDTLPIERVEFHVAEHERRWSQANRCC
jgi:uncharacterized short protein YbdD (DUF466 family)